MKSSVLEISCSPLTLAWPIVLIFQLRSSLPRPKLLNPTDAKRTDRVVVEV